MPVPRMKYANGICLYHAWTMPVPRMEHACTTHGTRLYHAWNMPVSCTFLAWNAPCTFHAWNMCIPCMKYAWNAGINPCLALTFKTSQILSRYFQESCMVHVWISKLFNIIYCCWKFHAWKLLAGNALKHACSQYSWVRWWWFSYNWSCLMFG